jgi:glycosyltransferase involved in cell wall biosynthesis
VRVLFVTHNVPRFDGDPAGSFVLRLAVALHAANARVEIIAPGAPGLPATGTIEGVTIHRVRYADDANMTLAYDGTMVEQVRRSWTGKRALLGLLRALRRAARAQVANARAANDAYDVVHAHWWFPAGLALWHAWPTRTPRNGMPARVLTVHGSDVRLAQSVAPAHTLLRRVLDDHAVSTAVSTWLADTAQRLAPGRELVVAPMPVDTRHFALPADASREGVLFVGRLNAQKGVADLLAALARPALHEAILSVVGDGPDRAALEAQAWSLGVATRVRWLGTLTPSALVPLYQQARVVAMPSREEGLGLVAVEAQLCGAPVVAYDSGGVVDVVRPDAGGTLVPLGDIAALAEALSIPLRDAAEATRRGLVARAGVLANFSPEVVAAQYIGLYHVAARA